MNKLYRFEHLNRGLYWVPSEPGKRFFTVHFKFMSGFNPVITEPLYTASSYRDAFDYLEAQAAITPNSKKRQLLVKQVGFKHRHYHYDERFDEALRVQDNLSGDEFYKEPTSDDKVYVQLNDGKPTWRGTRQRQDAWMDREWDDLTIST